jgi:hypothetical protein
VFYEPASDDATNVIAALPIGGRIKVDPWNDELRMLKSKAVGLLAADENMPFQITPFVFYLTRRGDDSWTKALDAVAAKLDADTKP